MKWKNWDIMKTINLGNISRATALCVDITADAAALGHPALADITWSVAIRRFPVNTPTGDPVVFSAVSATEDAEGWYVFSAEGDLSGQEPGSWRGALLITLPEGKTIETGYFEFKLVEGIVVP